MGYTLGEAALVVGKSKATISKALNSGKLSYVSKSKSGYDIEPSELFRVYPKRLDINVTERLETPIVNSEANELKALLKGKDELLDERLKRIEQLEKELARAQNQSDMFIRQITDQSTKSKKRFWQR